MIFGRPTNLWLGFAQAAVGFVSVTAVAAFHADAGVVALVGGSAGALLGALVVLVAGQNATVKEGDTINVVTPNGQPNTTLTV